jgi:Mrp family chromosome partitioning ATPase
MLEVTGARVLGVVLNKAKATHYSTSYDYYSSAEVDLRARVIETPRNILNSE